jgi:hypothetical protein
MPGNSKVRVDHETIDLIFQGNEHYAFYKGKRYVTLYDIVLACPALSDDDESVIPLAKVANHILFGARFKVIENIQDYITRYKLRFQSEQQTPNEDPNIRLLWSVRGDVEKVHSPLVENNHFSCWLEDNYLGLPFQLGFPFPYNKRDYTFTLKPFTLLK